MKFHILILTSMVILFEPEVHAETPSKVSMNTASSQSNVGAGAGAGQQSYEDTSAQLKVTRDARGRKMQFVDFNEVQIEGQARTPEGVMIQSRKSGKFRSLIELRSHFRDNIKIHALGSDAL